MGPNQTYKLLHSKGNHKQNEKTTYRMGENICKRCAWQGLNFQNIQIVHITEQPKKSNNPIKKWKELKQTFLQRRHRWPPETWKGVQHC